MGEYFENFLYGCEIRQVEVGDRIGGEDKVVKGRGLGADGERKEDLK